MRIFSVVLLSSLVFASCRTGSSGSETNFSGAAYAPGLTQIEGATHRCDSNDASKNLRYTFNVESSRIWHNGIDADPNKGWEFQAVEVNTQRCPDCYDITGKISDAPGHFKSMGFKMRRQGKEEISLHAYSRMTGIPASEAAGDHFSCIKL